MAAATSPFTRDTSFDSFLFSEIGEERNGMFLSVVSALARLDLDPWREAASLSRLSASAAAERLSSLLSSLPGALREAPAPATVLRLVKLLPKTGTEEVWRRAPAVVAKTNRFWPLAAFIILALLAICGEQWAARRGTEAPSGGSSSTSAGQTEGR